MRMFNITRVAFPSAKFLLENVCDPVSSLQQHNRTAHIRHKCRKTTVLNCHRCLINTVVEKMEKHLNVD